MGCCWRRLQRPSFQTLLKAENRHCRLMHTGRPDSRWGNDHKPQRRRAAFVSVWCVLSCRISDVMSSIADKVSRGNRLSFEEGVELYRSNDIVALGRLANR